MSRRSGQVGRIERKGNSYRARFWLDVPGVQKRIYKSVFIAPVSGPGSLNKFELKRRLKEIIAEAGANDEITLRMTEAVNLGTTFKQQAKWWIESVQNRKRKPIKAGTASSWKSAIRWINQQIGEIPLSSVNNLAVRDHVVAKMASEQNKDGTPRFSPKTISNYVGVVKMVVASAINDKGEEIYPVKWNHDFLDLPEVRHQLTPSFTGDEVNKIIDHAGRHAVLYALLAGTGLRIGEALALRIEDVKDSVIHVCHGLSAVTNELQTPKTKNGIREVDLHSSLALALSSTIAGRNSGFVFTSESGGPLCQANLLRRSLHGVLKKIGRDKCGFHSFRRFRVTHLRKVRVPEDLIRFWIGHADRSVTDGYSKVREDVEYRHFTAEQAGLGFDPPALPKPVAPYAPQGHPQFLAASV
ncbi:MAG TPA: tyrosine-type recombinase/integrase [Candidatus Aquilonibacter sp.]|nr:tyrosine-type recombinase/integrase [Candidatus Aquilonibacter sp.]